MKTLQAAAIAFVIIAITIAVGSIIINKMKEGGAYSNATNDTLDAGTSALSELSNWLGIIGLVIAASVVLRVITGGFGQSPQA